MKEAEVLREKWRITERRGGAVYKTEYLEDVWVPINSPEARLHTIGDIAYACKGTSFTGPTIRRAP